MNKFLYYLLNYTWGILATIIGYIVWFILLIFGRIRKCEEPYFDKVYWIFKKRHSFSFSIGTFVVLGWTGDDHVKKHEIGHSIQNAIFGPLSIFLVYIPSALRFWWREVYTKITKKNPATGYYDVWFEAQANTLGYNWADHRMLK